MNILSSFYFLVGFVVFKSVRCIEDYDRTPLHSPCDGTMDGTVPHKSRLNETATRPKNTEDRLATLINEAIKMLGDWDTFYSHLQKHEPIGKKTGTKLNNPSDNYDKSESAEWGTQHFDREQELIDTLEENEPGQEEESKNILLHKLEGGARSSNLAREIATLIKECEVEVLACKETIRQAKLLLLEAGNRDVQPEPSKKKTKLLKKLTEMYIEQGSQFLASAKAQAIVKEILYERKITSVFNTPEAEQLGVNTASMSGDALGRNENEAILELADSRDENIAPKQIDLNRQRQRRSDADDTNSTPTDIKNLFIDRKIGGVEITQLIEGGGVALTSATTLSATSPVPLLPITNAKRDEEKQSGTDSTHTVKGAMPLNFAQTSTTISSPKEINSTNNSTKSHKTVPRKGAEAGKIVGRKGVSDINVASLTLPNDSISGDIDVNPNLSSSNASHMPSQPIDQKMEIIEANPPLKKKPNPKPLTLTDKTSFNATTTPRARDSSQHDYVVPVVILIFAIPVVTILGTLLYKKGSEYWSRRHYRRMDFLIDGMYHD